MSRFRIFRKRSPGFLTKKTLEKEILRTINTKGEILDRASPRALSDIRQRLEGVREKAKGVLESLLRQENLQAIFQEAVHYFKKWALRCSDQIGFLKNRL